MLVTQIKQRTMSVPNQLEVQWQVEELLTAGLIEPSLSD